MSKTPGVLAIASTADTAPVILAQRLRKGAANSVRGAGHLVTGAPAALGRVLDGTPVLCRFDSAFYGYAPVSAALAGGANVSVTLRMDPAVNRAIASIPADARKSIEYTDAIFDEVAGTWTLTTGRWIEAYPDVSWWWVRAVGSCRRMGRWLFLVFGRRGVACCIAWCGAGSTSGGGFVVGTGREHAQPGAAGGICFRCRMFTRSSFRRSFSGADSGRRSRLRRARVMIFPAVVKSR